MQIVEHCELKKFSEFFSKFVFPSTTAIHYATTTRRYYNFAYFQYIAYQAEVLKHFGVDGDIQRDSWEFSFTYAFGFYALMRTSLEACRKLCDAIASEDTNGELKKYRELYRESIKRIVDIANDVVKHPFVPIASQPGGLDMTGAMDIYRWTEEDDSFKNVTVSPGQDQKTVHAYIEGLAEILSTFQTPAAK